MSQAKWVWIFGNFKLSETVVVSWIIIAALAIILGILFTVFSPIVFLTILSRPPIANSKNI